MRLTSSKNWRSSFPTSAGLFPGRIVPRMPDDLQFASRNILPHQFRLRGPRESILVPVMSKSGR